jgi:beta-galactosidase
MKISFYVICFLIITALFSACDHNDQANKFLFNSDWQFFRFEDDNADMAVIKNQETNWSSQYDISHVFSEANLSIPQKVLANEFIHLESAVWEKISLPHTPRIEGLTVLHQWQGICYYKKQFIADNDWKDHICYMEFEGAMHLADIWINGKHILQHAGGYTPFVIDISDYLYWGGTNEILLRLDNKNNPIIPPGKPLEKLDFCYYGGIYRDVYFIVKNKIHITHPILVDKIAGGGVFVTYPDVKTEKAIINVQTHIKNETDEQAQIEIRQRLLQIEGLFQDREIGAEIINLSVPALISSCEDIQLNQIIEVENPQLWSPSTPYLYLLKTEIVQNNKVIDSEEQRIGIRRINFSRENGFEINGEKVRLVGCNRHMEYPYIGNAISDQAQYRDIYHIKECGFNTVRLGHYPQDKSILDACDELGVLAIEPIPGWQFFNSDEQFCEFTYRDIRDMIRRDRNHASIILWEVILNESWPPTWWKDSAADVAHSEFPGNQCFTSGDSYGYFGWDVLYNDWQEGFKRPNNSGKAGFIREYYDYEFGGHYSTTRVKRGDGEKALLQNAWNAQWSHNRYKAYYPWTAGDAVWSMFDYNRGCCDNICHSGVADIFRIDKFSIPFFKSQMPVGQLLPSGKFKPYIFIANYWDNQANDDKLVVYANVDEVALFINGEQIARQKCDHGPDSDYADKQELWFKGGNPFDGGNCRQLEKPPFTFEKIIWKRGEIKAIGYINGMEVIQQVVLTPEHPYQLSISYFESGKPATSNDVLIVNVRIEDANGTLCVDDSANISLKILEGGFVVGPHKVSSEAGIASFLVKTGKSNRLLLKAISEFGEKSITWELGVDQ